MSLFDTLLGNASHADTQTAANTNTNQVGQKTTDTSSVQNTNQNQTSNQNSTTNSTTNQTNKSGATGQNVTSTLDAGTIQALQTLLPSLISQTNPNGGAIQALNQIAASFQAKSATPAISEADIAGKQSAAVTSFNQNEAVDISKLDNTIGSKGNTYSALVGAKGQQDLASTLAGIVADSKATNAQISDQQLSAAIQALTAGSSVGGQNIQNLMGIVSALKGATTTEDTSQNISGSTTQDTQAQTIQQLIDILSGVTTQNTNQNEQSAEQAATTSNTNTGGSQGSGFLGLFS